MSTTFSPQLDHSLKPFDAWKLTKNEKDIFELTINDPSYEGDVIKKIKELFPNKLHILSSSITEPLTDTISELYKLTSLAFHDCRIENEQARFFGLTCNKIDDVVFKKCILTKIEKDIAEVEDDENPYLIWQKCVQFAYGGAKPIPDEGVLKDFSLGLMKNGDEIAPYKPYIMQLADEYNPVSTDIIKAMDSITCDPTTEKQEKDLANQIIEAEKLRASALKDYLPKLKRLRAQCVLVCDFTKNIEKIDQDITLAVNQLEQAIKNSKSLDNKNEALKKIKIAQNNLQKTLDICYNFGR